MASVRLLDIVELIAYHRVLGDHLILRTVFFQRRLVRRGKHRYPRNRPRDIHKARSVARAYIFRRHAKCHGVRQIALPVAPGIAVPAHGDRALAPGRLRGHPVASADLVDTIDQRGEIGLGRLIEDRLHLVRHRIFLYHRSAGAQKSVEAHIKHLPGVFIGKMDNIGRCIGIVPVRKQPRGVVALQIVVSGLNQNRCLLVRACKHNIGDTGIIGGHKAPVALHLCRPAVGQYGVHDRNAGGRVGKGGISPERAAVL